MFLKSVFFIMLSVSFSIESMDPDASEENRENTPIVKDNNGHLGFSQKLIDAVVAEDMEFLETFKDAHGAMEQTIGFALEQLSIKYQKPRVFLFACETPRMIGKGALAWWVSTRHALDDAQIDLYYATLDMLKQREQNLRNINSVLAGVTQLLMPLLETVKEYAYETDPAKPHAMSSKLQKAIESNNVAKVQECIDRGHSLSATTDNYMNALQLALHCANREIFMKIAEHSTYINEQQRKVLLTYAPDEHTKSLVCIDLATYIAKRNEELNNAVAQGSYSSDVIGSLLAGANPNMPQERSPAWAAVSSAHPLKLKILLKQGANPNARGLNGQHLLAHALGQTHEFQLIELLLKHGSDPNASAYVGGEPLANNLLRFAGNVSKPLKQLLEHGSNPNAKNEDGYSLLDIAVTRSKEEQEVLVPLLKRYGAKHTPAHAARHSIDRVIVNISNAFKGFFGTLAMPYPK